MFSGRVYPQNLTAENLIQDQGIMRINIHYRLMHGKWLRTLWFEKLIFHNSLCVHSGANIALVRL